MGTLGIFFVFYLLFKVFPSYAYCGTKKKFESSGKNYKGYGHSKVTGTKIEHSIMADKVIYAMYDDDDTLMNGAKHLVKKELKYLMCILLFRYTN